MTGPWDQPEVVAAVKAGLLDPERHDRLVCDAAHFCALAGIEVDRLWQPLSASAGPNEVQWLRGHRLAVERGTYGLLYIGAMQDVAERMAALTAAYLRRLIDARLRSVSDLFEAGLGSSLRTCSVLLLPDFCLGLGSLPPIHRQAVASVLMERATAHRPTVLYAASFAAVQESYGAALRGLLEDDKRYARIVL